jgi:hypothetical protein
MQERTKTQRQMNISRVPIMRSQIRSLRSAAERVHSSLDKASLPDQWGVFLVAGMNAGFALELGLKLFFMTYHMHAVRGHDLRELFRKLPAQMQGDIRESYAASVVASSLPANIKVLALRTSKQQPEKPKGFKGNDVSNADGLFEDTWDAFEQGRYFFEKVDSDGWVKTGYPIEHMLLMSGVLDLVYDTYLERGGWT